MVTAESERNLYPVVERWMKKRFRCFKTEINFGLSCSRVDVLGVRDIGGDLSGDVETIGIEVKGGAEPFATASGQALGYQVYVNRVYLADVRQGEFKPNEIDIASHLGIGFIQIKGSQCREVLSSPHHNPIPRMSLELLDRMALGHCRFCGVYFGIGTEANRMSKVTRKSLKAALEKEKGFVFWNFELADRKRRLGMRNANNESSSERRYVCHECLKSVFSKISEIE